MFKDTLATDKDTATILIRVMVGVVFLSEGVQKFIFPDTLGVGRFLHTGFRFPEFLANFTGAIEISCALFILIGLGTRLAAIPLMIIMIFAFETTKYTIFLRTGFWNFMHEDRTDFSMQLGLLYLMLKGSGAWSVDHIISRSFGKFKIPQQSI